MREGRYRAVLRLAIVGFLFVLVGCDGAVRVRGAVRDLRGEPVAGAKIHVTSMDQYWRTVSGTDGCFLESGTTDPMHSYEPLTVEAAGYKTASTKVRAAYTRNQVIVILVPSDSSDTSRIQLLAPGSDKDLAPCDKSNF